MLAHFFIGRRARGLLYRVFTKNIAAWLILHGWVKNLYDGRVEAAFESGRWLINKAGECGKRCRVRL